MSGTGGVDSAASSPTSTGAPWQSDSHQVLLGALPEVVPGALLDAFREPLLDEALLETVLEVVASHTWEASFDGGRRQFEGNPGPSSTWDAQPLDVYPSWLQGVPVVGLAIVLVHY